LIRARQQAYSGVSHKRRTTKRLSLRLPELTFTSYAEARCTQQNAKSSGETLQNYCPWQGFENAFLATPSDVDEKREAQTPPGQSSVRRPHRCGENKNESSLWLKVTQAFLPDSVAQGSPRPSLCVRNTRPPTAIMAASVWSLVTKVRRRDFSRCTLRSDRRRRAYGRAAVPLPGRF